MSHIEKSVYVDKALSFAQGLAFRYRHEFITPEHILSALFNQDPFVEAVEECFCHIPVMEEEVDEYLAQKMEQVPEDTNYELQFSVQSNLLFQNAYAFLESSNAEVLDIPHVVQAMYNPQIQISAESGTKRSNFRQKDKTKRSKKRLHTTLIKPEQKVNEDLCSGFIVS